ncbi:MAG: Asp-tRNA(Asn)/Glu-tRNA(Gln) amidotransferase GatCAB subunit C [Parcubacteria group bacterium CG11_big_fil_rev_8_21_14_0_20_41_14]|nr:MAG: Asp-tRNA(Asn)/Glu-tRNA(Gln) amidotransferase GatCAB subunit C [Parcubacteria group bacterium CG22_combo_CG10-13_8_21_14_all_41_9]PIQ79639.1 MAG: Asp-tRNA(Asn)/Glu-tRNA(Gln) amidotransferase GatCAB subunit C [Parcubacteria group bacterium CG11_big_fil_rev_8_21_14_0_20_41_14]PIR56913.1 MAG: Asp-tRNA(Asn)/Glu-tRNA(Gln) amidotransferase GatCAB subunit C [Parcubacteria group bacterium CG10_big_fil_rev_8_21_14_0_10_41_35]PIZ82129.1 MAG: Asp-tRNA(Asn)/Glu-tRNA(Gln) amidotransferase GatCAB subun
MGKISKKEVEKIAKLARLELSDKEVDTYAQQLSAILGYVDQLQEVDTKNVEITSQVTGLSNIMREDVVESFDNSEELVKMAPENQDNLIKVKAVFE